MIKRRELRNRRNDGIDCTYFTINVEVGNEPIEFEFSKDKSGSNTWRCRYIDSNDRIYQCFISTEFTNMSLETVAAKGLNFMAQLFKEQAQKNMDAVIKINQMTEGM